MVCIRLSGIYKYVRVYCIVAKYEIVFTMTFSICAFYLVRVDG